jgi:hypothetical protein
MFVEGHIEEGGEAPLVGERLPSFGDRDIFKDIKLNRDVPHSE